MLFRSILVERGHAQDDMRIGGTLIHIWKSHEVPWCAYQDGIKEFAEWP